MNLSPVLFEAVGALFTVIALVYILAASIKLVRASKLPGAKLIFGSVVFMLVGALLSGLYPFVLGIAETVFIEGTIDAAVGMAFFAGAHGFWRLAHGVAVGAADRPR